MTFTVLWERMYVPPAPDATPCTGADPWLFEIDYHSGVNVIRRDGTGPSAGYAERIGVALRYCETCPLASREWCVDAAVKPQLSGFSGVAGAAVWSNGRRVWDIERQRNIPTQREAGAA
jgi:hypothetical protein